MKARSQQRATRAGTSAGAVLVLLQFAVVAGLLVMGHVDWERTIATAPQPVASAEAHQGPADVDPSGTVTVPIERVVPVGTTAAEAASAAVVQRRPPVLPLAVIAADVASKAPLRAVRLGPPDSATPAAAAPAEPALVPMDPSGIPLPPPAD
jgi:hypothetical protein